MNQELQAYNACLSSLSKDVRYRTTSEASETLDEYLKIQNTIIQNIESNKSDLVDAEIRRTNFLAWTLSRKLSECLDLSDGPSKSRYIFMVGQQAHTDGEVFHFVAGSLIQELLNNICPGAAVECKKQIVLKRQIQKSDLLIYLKLLSPQSVKRISFEGHGWADGLLISYKDMLVPEDWNKYMKTPLISWQKYREGAIYSDDLSYIGPAFARVLDLNAVVDLRTCEAGQRLAPILRGQLPKSVSVQASTSGMSIKEGKPGWILRLETGEEFRGKQTSMISESPKDFGNVNPIPFSQEILDPKNIKQDPGDNGLDDMTSFILTRVSRLSSWHAWIEQKKTPPRLITFDELDRKIIISLFVDTRKKAHVHELDDDDLPVTNSQYRAKVQARMAITKDERSRAYLRGLFERIDTCITEAVRIHY